MVRMMHFKYSVAQSAGAVEYTDCTCAEGLAPPPNECPRYDIKQSDGEVPVMMGLWEMQSTPSFRPGMVTPDRALSMG